MSPDSDARTPLADHPSSASGYDTYTDSGVDWLGDLPAHWELRALKYSADFIQEKLDSKPEDLPYIGLEHIESETGNLAKDEAVDDVSSKVVHFKEGDVLFGKLRPYLAKVLLADERGVGTTELVPMRPVNDVDERFLAYQLLSKGFIDVVDAQTYGARMPRVSPDQLAEQKIALPPPAEQRAIADFLDRATTRIDTLIEKKERLVELLEEKRSALVSHVVTTGLDDDAELQDSSVEWLGEIPAGWETAQLRHLIRPNTTITYGIVQAGPHMEDGIPYIRTGDMKGRSLPEDGYKRTDPEIDAKYSRSKLEAGDIVVAIRATVGKALQVPEYLDGANLTQGTARVAPGEEVSNRFLLWAINARPSQQRFDALSKGATFDEITLDMLRRLEVPLPPVDEQRAIADHLDETTAQIDALIERVQDGIERLREYRTALISAAVTGEIDVRDRENEEDEN
jgi:type I restriction enzyme S subunit